MGEKQTQTIELININPRMLEITIVGDTALVLHAMDAVSKREMINKQTNKQKELKEVNKWEKIITSIHWLDEYDPDYTEEAYKRLLKKNKPCITAFGMKANMGDAYYRNGLGKKTVFNANVNVIDDKKGLIPITFAGCAIEEKLISPGFRKPPCLQYLNVFDGWKAKVTVSFLENMFSVEQIVNLMNLTGFGIGIGSGRNAGYGRYHVENVEAI